MLFFHCTCQTAHHRRFQAENIEKNESIYYRIESLAKKHHCTPPQLALAWVLQQGNRVVPIPGLVSDKIKIQKAIKYLNMTTTTNYYILVYQDSIIYYIIVHNFLEAVYKLFIIFMEFPILLLLIIKYNNAYMCLQLNCHSS